MGVSWVSLNQNDSVVQYGLVADKLDEEVRGYITTYPSAGWIGNIHRATMHSLSAGSTYYYRVGDGATKWSSVFSFATFSNQETEMVSYMIIGDMAYDEISDDTVKSMISLVNAGKVQAVIHSGDISYADGYEPHWDDFFNKIEPIASRVPYMVAPGNHEFWYNFSSYKARFYMPGVMDKGGSGDNMFYSWEQGPAHFISMNSETAIDTANFSSAEIAWLEDDLKHVDRTKKPWVIVNMHRPM